MIKTMLIAGATLAASLPCLAQAQSLPRYDMAAACRDAAAIGAGSTVKECVRSERDAYAELKSGWGDLDANVRAGCQQAATASGPASYALLLGCVTIETSASSEHSMQAAFEEREF